MRTALVALVIILIVLAWANPDMPAFRTFVETHSERILLEELDEEGDSAVGRALAGAGGMLAGAVIDRVTERRNFVFFSTYTIDLDPADGDDDAWKFVGLAGQFLETQNPAEEN